MEWWFCLWAVDYWLPFEMCPPKQQSLPRTIFCLLYGMPIHQILLLSKWPDILLKEDYYGKHVKISLPPFCGHIHLETVHIVSIPTAQRPTKNDPSSREVFGETPDLAAFQSLVDSVFFLGGGWWNIENTWNLEFLSTFLGRFWGPSTTWLRSGWREHQQMPFWRVCLPRLNFPQEKSHMIYLDM